MQLPPLPVDKNVRIGKLDNGLTYYIRHNEKPENRVEFYIAQKVGSILEEPEQRGLAHFLEHMAFNGTKNFPGDERGLGIVQWCESKGIKFGTNLNAYTAVDETVYLPRLQVQRLHAHRQHRRHQQLPLPGHPRLLRQVVPPRPARHHRGG